MPSPCFSPCLDFSKGKKKERKKGWEDRIPLALFSKTQHELVIVLHMTSWPYELVSGLYFFLCSFHFTPHTVGECVASLHSTSVLFNRRPALYENHPLFKSGSDCCGAVFGAHWRIKGNCTCVWACCACVRMSAMKRKSRRGEQRRHVCVCG